MLSLRLSESVDSLECTEWYTLGTYSKQIPKQTLDNQLVNTRLDLAQLARAQCIAIVCSLQHGPTKSMIAVMHCAYMYVRSGAWLSRVKY